MKKNRLVIKAFPIFYPKDKYDYRVYSINENKELANSLVEHYHRFTRIYQIDNLGNKHAGLGSFLLSYIINEAKKRDNKWIILELVGSEEGLKFCKRHKFNLMNDSDYAATGYDKRSVGHEGRDFIKSL